MRPSELRHELRTPLNQVVGYSEMLLEDLPPEQNEGRKLVGELRDRAYQLVDRIGKLIPPGEDEPSAQLAGRVRTGIGEQVQQLATASEELAARPEPVFHPFADHIRAAANSLQEFTSGAALEREVPIAAPEHPENTGPGGARLLVADDNERNREVLVHQLRRQGYSVTAVCDGTDVIRMLKEREFDLALLDVFMPKMNGFATLEAIKHDTELREIPVIMISASDEYSSVIRCIESGAEDYLPKPFDPVLLRARLKASLDKKALRDEQKRKTDELERAYQNLQRMQDQLVTQEKLASLGSLAAGIAHEIKNPLNFITNFARLSSELVEELKASVPNDPASAARKQEQQILEDLEANLHRIEEHGARADRIVRGMLGHARKSTGEREASELNALAVEGVNLAYHGVRSKDAAFNVSLKFDLDPAIGRVSVFPQDLSRVFLNIASNAFHAMAEKMRGSDPNYEPTLWLQTRAVPGAAEIRIRDNGPGIPDEIRHKIFDPFFTTKPAGRGTGLGLSISHEIVVKEHGGELSVSSVPGEYTEFRVRIPRQEAGK